MSSLMTSVTCTRATTNTQRLRTLPVCGSVTKTIETSSTRMSGYKLPWNRGAVESPGCWMNQEQNFNCHHPTQLNPKLGRPYFPKINQTHKPKPTPTFSQFGCVGAEKKWGSVLVCGCGCGFVVCGFS